MCIRRLHLSTAPPPPTPYRPAGNNLKLPTQSLFGMSVFQGQRSIPYMCLCVYEGACRRVHEVNLYVCFSGPKVNTIHVCVCVCVCEGACRPVHEVNLCSDHRTNPHTQTYAHARPTHMHTHVHSGKALCMMTWKLKK